MLRGWSALVSRAASVASGADEDPTLPPPAPSFPDTTSPVPIASSPPPESATLHEELAPPIEALLESPPTEVGEVPGLAAALAAPRRSDTVMDTASPFAADAAGVPATVPDTPLPPPAVPIAPAITGPRMIREKHGPTSRPPPPPVDPLANVPVGAPLAPRSPGERGEAVTMLNIAVAMGMAPEPAAPQGAASPASTEQKPYVDAVIPDTPDGTGAAPGALGELRAPRPVPQSVIGRIVEERIGGWITLASFFARFAPLMIALFLLIAILIALLPMFTARRASDAQEGRAVYVDEAREAPKRSAMQELIEQRRSNTPDPKP